jgi:vitamin B12 transporter
MKRALYRSSLYVLAVALGGLATPALADPTPDTPVVVTAVRLPATLSTTPDAYVIDAKDIEAVQATFAGQILATVPGISVFSNGQFGVTSVRIRGAASDKTLVLIDGVPVNDASQPAGSYDFAGLDLADVSRVELLSGPQASLWGSDAIGGVISFTTREPNGVRADVEGGSFGTSRVSGAVGRSTDRWALGVTVSDFASTGISAADSRNGNTEPDGYRDLTLGARGRVSLTDWISLDGQVRYNKSVTAIDGYPFPAFSLADTNDVAISESTLGYVHAHIDGAWGLHHDLSVSDYRLRRGDSGDSGDFGYHSERQIYRWTIAHGAASNVLAVEGGLEREADRASVSTGDELSLGTSSAFGVVHWRPTSRLNLTGSLRYDAPDHYAAQTTGRIAGSLDLGGGFTVLASAGQGFKTPTISETVCDFCFPSGPSTGLRPEHAVGYDLGLGWRSGDGRLGARATAYGLDQRDEIVYLPTFPFRYFNVARTRSRGIELVADAALGAGFRLKASYGYTDARDVSTGLRELRVPLNSGSASLSWTHGRADATFSVRSESDQSDTGLDFTPVTRPGFTVADLAAGFKLTEHIRVTGRIENLAGVHYQQVFGYGEPGRAVFVGLHFRE